MTADFDFSQYTSSSSDFTLSDSTSSTAAATDFLGETEDATGYMGPSEAAGPPYLWLLVGIALATVGILLAALWGSSIVVAFVAWALAGPIAIGAFAVFSLRDTKQRAKPLYGQRASAVWLHRGGLALAFVGVVLSALAIAEWAGRL